MNRKKITIDGRDAITCREAAAILGQSMSQVRKLARLGTVWAYTISARSVVFDRAELAARASRRSVGTHIAGRPRLGFRAD